jgi:hypothetical protein
VGGRRGEHESRFDDEAQENVRIAALLSMIPRNFYDQRFKGRLFITRTLRQDRTTSDRRPTIQIKSSREVPMGHRRAPEKELNELQET